MKLFKKMKPVLGASLRRFLIRGSLLILVLGSLLTIEKSLAGDITVIGNIKEWQHPVKAVFNKHKVILDKVELQDKTYPIFYVKFPYDPWLGHNDKYFKPLYYETLKANGFWDYTFIDRSFHCKIHIKWDKKSKTLTESLDDLK
jgi:hypothetical protein